MGDSDEVGKGDYRESHLHKGGSYDETLAMSPFDAYMGAWEAHHVPAIVRSAFPNGPSRYLDFACGTGRITQLIAPMAREAVGVDISDSMIASARSKCAGASFRVVDITRDDADLGSFDLVSSFRFFGNAQQELREAALRAIAKRVAPGGRLLINSHRNPRALYALFDRMTGGDAGVMDLHLTKLRRLLADHGFGIEHLQPIGAWMYRASLMVRAKPHDDSSRRLEARFGGSWLAPVSPDVIVLARKIRARGPRS